MGGQAAVGLQMSGELSSEFRDSKLMRDRFSEKRVMQ